MHDIPTLRDWEWKVSNADNAWFYGSNIGPPGSFGRILKSNLVKHFPLLVAFTTRLSARQKENCVIIQYHKRFYCSVILWFFGNMNCFVFVLWAEPNWDEMLVLRCRNFLVHRKTDLKTSSKVFRLFTHFVYLLIAWQTMKTFKNNSEDSRRVRRSRGCTETHLHRLKKFHTDLSKKAEKIENVKVHSS